MIFHDYLQNAPASVSMTEPSSYLRSLNWALARLEL